MPAWWTPANLTQVAWRARAGAAAPPAAAPALAWLPLPSSQAARTDAAPAATAVAAVPVRNLRLDSPFDAVTSCRYSLTSRPSEPEISGSSSDSWAIAVFSVVAMSASVTWSYEM